MVSRQLVAIGQGTNTALINVPIEAINLTTWFFTLTAAEYVACSSGHNGIVQGSLPNGKRVSVSVETIGGNFILNNFIEDIAHREQVCTISNTVAYVGVPDSIYTARLKVTWKIKLSFESSQTCRFISIVTTETADRELITKLQSLPPSDSNPFQDHWRRETPLFAADIERKARLGLFS